MKKFQFRLQVVLDIKEKLLEQKLLELSKVQRGLQDAVNKQKTLEGYQAEINEALLNVLPKAEMSWTLSKCKDTKILLTN